MSDIARVATPRDLPDWLLARGRPWVTNDDITGLLNVSAEEASRVAGRWHAKGHAFSPARGLQMLIPAEYRSWGALPANQFIDPMMKHLNHAYYVAYLSAAEVHGAAHQRPQVFQVATDARVRARQFGRVRVEFFSSVGVASRPTVSVNTPTGTMIVSSPETTVLDLLAHPRRGAGTSNVATIIGELLETQKIDANRLAELSEQYPASVANRTGWLVEFMANAVSVDVDLSPLLGRVDRRIAPSPLFPSEPRRGRVDPTWNVCVNGEVEPDQ